MDAQSSDAHVGDALNELRRRLEQLEAKNRRLLVGGLIVVALLVVQTYWERYRNATFNTIHAREIVLRHGISEAKVFHGGLFLFSEKSPRATILANPEGAKLTLYNADGKVGHSIATLSEESDSARMQQLIEEKAKKLKGMSPEQFEAMQEEERRKLKESAQPSSEVDGTADEPLDEQ